MDVIHPLSSITPLPEFDLWGVPPTQITVDRIIDAEYRSLTAVDSLSPIIFQITSAADEYLKLDEIYLSWNAQFEFSKSDGTALTTDEIAGLKIVNYAMNSMISQIDFSINNKHVSNLPQNYPYRAYVEALLGFSQDVKNTILTAAKWTNFGKTSIDMMKDKKKSIVYNMMGRLHTDMSFQGKYLIGGSDVKIELSLESPKFYLMCDDKISVKLILSDVTLHVQKAKVSKETVIAHKKALEISPAKYPFTRCEVKHIVLPKGINDVWIDNVVFGQLPRRIFVFLVKNSAFSGSLKEDPFNFQPFGLNHIVASIDGVSYPSNPYTPSFDDKKFMREYIGLYDALNQNKTDALCNITLSEFETGKTIFGFNFSSDLSNGCGMEGHANLIKRGALRLQLKFKSALSNPINVGIYCEFDNILEINSNGEVSTNINNV